MIRPHRIALDPNHEQAIYLARAAGVARFSWNWALAEWQRQYNEWREYRCGPRPSEAALRRQLNDVKAEQFPWMLEVTKNAPEQAIKHVYRSRPEPEFAARHPPARDLSPEWQVL